MKDQACKFGGRFGVLATLAVVVSLFACSGESSFMGTPTSVSAPNVPSALTPTPTPIPTPTAPSIPVSATWIGKASHPPSYDVTPVAVEGFGGPEDHLFDFPNTTPIGVGQSIKDSAYWDEVDTFKVSMDAGHFYQIDVSREHSNRSRITVHDAEGREIAYKYNCSDETASPIIWEPPATGVYYIKVWGSFACRSLQVIGLGSYTLTVVPVDISDDYPNSSNPLLSSAALWESIRGSIDYSGDVDLFRLTGDAGQFYRINVVLGTLDDSVLAVYDAHGREVAYNDDYGDGYASRIIWEAPATGFYYIEAPAGEVYYIEVLGGGWAAGSYTLSIERINIFDIDDPNFQVPWARSVIVGESIDAAIEYTGDVDVFQFSVVAGRLYRIEVAPITLQMIRRMYTLNDSVLTVYDVDGREVAYNDDYGYGSPSGIVWEAPATGVYYIEVSGAIVPGSYTLTVEPIDVSDDYPNSPGPSLPSITPGESIEGAIDYVGDVDVFEVSGDPGQYYHVVVRPGTISVLFMTITVYDSQSGAIIYMDDYASYKAPATGVFYVALDGHDDITGSYTLTLPVVLR